MATAANAQLLEMSGPRNPYDLPLGRILPGAAADLLLVDGEPLADLAVFMNSDSHLRLIMKDGRICKNTL